MALNTDGTVNFDATIELLWRKPRSRTRGPKPAHSLDDLLDAAIRLADEEGLEAVSMQRLADQVGFTKMAIYRYLPGRTELIALMTDRCLGAPPKRFQARGWRRRLEAWAMAAFEVFMAHPWGIEATTGRRVFGPNEVSWMETGLNILAATELDGSDRLDVLGVIMGHLRSIAQQAAAGSSLTLETEFYELATRALEGHEEIFPQFCAASRQAAFSGKQNNGLGFGLHCILDGVEARMLRHA